MLNRLLGVLLVSAMAAGCGGGDSPTSPSPPQVAQVGGVWAVTHCCSAVYTRQQIVWGAGSFRDHSRS
jgi:hypothetical protein